MFFVFSAQFGQPLVEVRVVFVKIRELYLQSEQNTGRKPPFPAVFYREVNRVNRTIKRLADELFSSRN